MCYWIGGPIFGGLIPEGAYFWNFTVCVLPIAPFLHKGTTGLGGPIFGGLIHGGAYFWNFTVCVLPIAPFLHKGTTFHKRPINLCILGGP